MVGLFISPEELMNKKLLLMKALLAISFFSVNGWAIIDCKTDNTTFELADLNADNSSNGILRINSEQFDLNCYLYNANDKSGRICLSKRVFATQYEVSIYEKSAEKIEGTLVKHLGFHSWEQNLECSYRR